MYLLWQPPKLKGSGADSIPVPIGYDQWHFVADTVLEQKGRKMKWKNPVNLPTNNIGSLIPSTANDPNTWDGYPQWTDKANPTCSIGGSSESN
jgi:hypothetical protein